MSKSLGKFITHLIKFEVNTEPGSQGKQNISHNSLLFKKEKRNNNSNNNNNNKRRLS